MVQLEVFEKHAGDATFLDQKCVAELIEGYHLVKLLPRFANGILDVQLRRPAVMPVILLNATEFSNQQMQALRD